jgi:mono/diheme cytochrome c family protein
VFDRLKRTIKIALLTLLVAGFLAAAGGAAFIYSGIYDIAASRPHLNVTASLLDKVSDQSVRRHASDIVPPDLDDPELIQRGVRLYEELCVTCHGAPGVAKSRIGIGMNPNPPPLEDTMRLWKPAEVFWIIEHGLKMAGMPAFGLGESPRDSWALTAAVIRMQTASPDSYADMVEAARTRAAFAWVQPQEELGWDALRLLGDPQEGKRLVGGLGCGACHRVPGAVRGGGRLAPPLDRWARRRYIAGRLPNTPAQLVRWIQEPQRIKPGTAMPAVGASEREAWHVASYLYTLQ